jgi:hypothetical protein
MKRISQYGGGLFHHVIDPTSLPQIVLETPGQVARRAAGQ